MYDKDIEPFSNPLAPPSSAQSSSSDTKKDTSVHHHQQSVDAHPLTNDDFRKLLMTPRIGSMPTPAPGSSTSMGISSSSTGGQSTRGTRGPKTVLKQEMSENRKKKRKFYATLKKQEDDTLAELALKYRDRARERRDGDNPDYGHDQAQDIASATAAYRAVAPDIKSGMDAAERRKQMIQESKFLGGDMEHTHLVKGLDYALLQKVRSEIQYKEKEEKDTDTDTDTKKVETSSSTTTTTSKSKKQQLPDVPDIPTEESPNDDDPYAIKSLFAQNIMRSIKTQLPERNDLFVIGRMAYIVDLEDECADSDIPTTVIRSKAECPNLDSINTLSTNDIVINKLMQILSYLRQGGGATKKLKKGKDKIVESLSNIGNVKHHDNSKLSNNTKIASVKVDDVNIYDDIGDYVPDIKRKDYRNDRDHREHRERDHHRNDYRHRDRDDRDLRHRDSHRDREKDYNRNTTRERDRGKSQSTHNYFQNDKNVHDDDDDDNEYDLRKDHSFDRDSRSIAASAIRGHSSIVNDNAITNQRGSKSVLKMDHDVPESYAECYPGAPETDDAILDSDDEVDYSKMDLGNKKGLIGRWDFDTAEEYGDYMSHKEALPKAAFQYGVKMADGRKTRRVQGKRDEKAKLDRDLQKINAIIAKRKAEGGDGGGSSGIQFNTPMMEHHKRHKNH